MSTPADALSFVSRVPLPVAETYELVTRGMSRWWPYGHRLGDIELVAVVLDGVKGGRWFQRDVQGLERELGQVVNVLPPSSLSIRSVVGVGYGHDPRGLFAIDVVLEADQGEDIRVGTTVTWTLSGFDRLGPGGEQLRDDFAGRYGWRDMADALSSAVER